MLAKTNVPRIAVISMQKNESELLPIWLDYYRRLVGAANVYLIDNGSDLERTKVELEAARASGINVVEKPGQNAFERKGPIIQELARSLEGQYDAVIPIDGDEFLTIKNAPDSLMARNAFETQVNAFLVSDQDYALITCHFLNVAGTSIVVRRPFRKVIIRPTSNFVLNRGFHYQPEQAAAGYETQLAYLHFHHKADIEVMQNLAISKIGEARYKSFVDAGGETAIKGNGKHMAKYIAMSQEHYKTYMERISGERIDVSGVFAGFEQKVPFA